MNELEQINPFQILAESLKRIEETLAVLIENIPNHSIIGQEPELIGITDAAKFLGLSKQAIYRHIGKIAHYKRNGRLYFKRGELMNYVEGGKRIVKR